MMDNPTQNQFLLDPLPRASGAAGRKHQRPTPKPAASAWEQVFGWIVGAGGCAFVVFIVYASNPNIDLFGKGSPTRTPECSIIGAKEFLARTVFDEMNNNLAAIRYGC